MRYENIVLLCYWNIIYEYDKAVSDTPATARTTPTSTSARYENVVLLYNIIKQSHTRRRTSENHVHSTFTQCSFNVHSVFTHCSRHVLHSLYIALGGVGARAGQCSLNVYSMFTQSSLNVHSVFTQCSLNNHSLFSQGSSLLVLALP
jgi:hypothetical protein